MKITKVFFVFIFGLILSFFYGCNIGLMNMKGFLSEEIFNMVLVDENPESCLKKSFLPTCMGFCHEFENDPQCIGKIDYCFYYPTSSECLASCLKTPDDPTCPPLPDCISEPGHPACILYCSFYPEELICENSPGSFYSSIYDSYSQTQNLNKVDIIWIMDNSSSMDDEQDALANNFSSFIDEFSKNGVDFKMGITTTDTTGLGSVFLHNGEFQGAFPVLDSSMDPIFIEDNFITNIKVGVDGSFIERGLYAAELAVQKNSDPFSNNFEFLRPDAFLAIIIVSDENDASPNSTESYVNNIIASKSDPSQVGIYPIVDTITPSLHDPYTTPIDLLLYLTASPNPGGLRYINASNATNGFSINIHDNFSNSIFEIGGGILSHLNRYRCLFTPALDSVNIIINGISVPHDSNNGWTFNFDTSSIYFHGSFIPQVGALVEISFKFMN